MSIQTNVYYYCTDVSADFRGFIQPVLSFLNVVEDSLKVSRVEEEPVWIGPFNRGIPSFDFARQITELEAVPGLLLEGRVLYIDFLDQENSLRKELESELSASVAPEIRGDYRSCNSTMVVGRHDLFGSAGNDGAEEYFGSAGFSVHFWGYRAPTDIVRYRQAVLNSSVSQRIQAGLEKILNQRVAQHVFMNM